MFLRCSEGTWPEGPNAIKTAKMQNSERENHACENYERINAKNLLIGQHGTKYDCYEM